MGFFFFSKSKSGKDSSQEQDSVLALSEVIADLKKKLEQEKKRANDYWDLYTELKKKVEEEAGVDPKELFRSPWGRISVPYTIEQDGDYVNIIANQDDDTTISFNREFDTSKENYNWVNEGEALITLKFNNVPKYYGEPTIIRSPVSGIFESIRNKMAVKGDVVCRIRTIPQEQKEETIATLERESIKNAILKKEQKKKIERETLDELIAEGKVFNVVTLRNGQRTTIPSDIASSVWNRDGGVCCICGAREDLEFDHIIPISKGGATSFRNLQLLCRSCNMKKSDNI